MMIKKIKKPSVIAALKRASENHKSKNRYDRIIAESRERTRKEREYFYKIQSQPKPSRWARIKSWL